MTTQKQILDAMSSDVVLKAMRYGIKCHKETNHRYDEMFVELKSILTI